MLSLLQERDQQAARAREVLRARVRDDLRIHLEEVVGGAHVWIFGSLCHEGRFHRQSDIDIAFESLPEGWELDALTGELMDRMERPVDIIILSQSRLADKIRREGELWTL